MSMEVRDIQLMKQHFPKLVTAKAISEYVTLSEMVTSLAEPLYIANSAVFVSVSNLYSNPSSVVYSMVSAFIAKPMAANREMSMNLKVNVLFILKMFLPMAPSWRLMERLFGIQIQRTWSQSCHSSHA